MSNTKTIGKAFNDYIDAVGLGHLSKKCTQIVELRRAFFGGAVFVFNQSIFYDENVIDTDEKIMQNLEDIQIELDNFVAGVEIGEL